MAWALLSASPVQAQSSPQSFGPFRPAPSGIIPSWGLHIAAHYGLPGQAQSAAETVRAFYRGRHYKPYWTHVGEGQGSANAAANFLAQSWTHGLNPETYHAAEINRLLADPAAQNSARLELLLTDAVMAYGRDISGMRMKPSSIGQNGMYWRQPLAGDVVLQKVMGGADPVAALNKLAPQDMLYRKMREELIRLSAQDAGAPPISFSGRAPKPGQRAAGIDLLHRRMGIAAAGDAAFYDAKLADAVKGFQARHGLKPDGVIGAKTLALLNESPRARMERLVVNMERLRWIEPHKPSRFVLVNIPSQTLLGVDGSRITLRMPVVVGKTESPTKMFRADITGVRFNPRWHVPQSIKMRDLLPELRADPAKVAAKGIRITQAGRSIDPSTVDWGSISAGEMGRMNMVQDSGEHNALGLVRILMPNEYDIYMHDTNHRNLFVRDNRFFSSGCVRLSRPNDMAKFVLEGKKDWTEARMNRVLAKGAETDVSIERSMAVYIVYFTAWLDDKNNLVYEDDIYGEDRKLLGVMARSGSYWLPESKITDTAQAVREIHTQLAAAY